MPISESQLETWTHIGAQQTAKSTADSIRFALANYTDWPENIKFEDYLQGSYKNSTNIRGDSDVDLVVQLNSSFYCNLTDEEQSHLEISNASYGFPGFRSDVLTALKRHFGIDNIIEGNKSIKLKAGNGRLAADVVVCVLYRKYNRTYGVSTNDFVEGMTFWTRNYIKRIINYPKIHYENGTVKNNQTNDQYKKTVRLFKNIRTYLVDNNIISEDLAPSYFLECLIYNIANRNFSGSWQDIFINCVHYLKNTNLNEFLCQNEQELLFGLSDNQWKQENALKLLIGMLRLWSNL